MSCGWSRRRVLKTIPAFGLFGLLPINLTAHSEVLILLPPGAVEDFLARCIRCGKCLQACPYNSIRFLGSTSGGQANTPYVDPLVTPCYLCQHRGADGNDQPLSKYLRCGEVCPTGALRKIVNDKKVLARVPAELKMGVSTLDRDLCLAWQYDSCGECYYNCPLKDEAILGYPRGEEGLTAGLRPWVDENHCIGCGMCNFVCPVNDKMAASLTSRHRKFNAYEERYASQVRNVLGRGGKGKLPAIRVQRSK